MSYQNIIFDLDGTILDTLNDLTDSVNYSLKCFGFPIRTIDEIRCFVGNGINRLIELSVPDNTAESAILDIIDVFNEHYSKHCSDKTKPYDGVIELLEYLKNNGKNLAVVSNKPHYAVIDLCNIHFKDIFSVSVGQRKNVRKKPFPDLVFKVMEALNADTSNTVYIGDSEVDIATAKNSGLDCISVSWGFRSIEQLKKNGAAVIVDFVDSLYDLL